MFEWLTKLIARPALFLIVVGLVVVVIGAAGSVPLLDPPLEIKDQISRIVVLCIGLVILIIGIVTQWRQPTTSATTLNRLLTSATGHYLDEPVLVSSKQKNRVWIESDFLLWERGAIMLWVYVPDKGSGLRNAPSNRYLLAHHTGECDKEYTYFNQFCFRYSLRNEWEVTYSNSKCIYPSERAHISDGLQQGWHHFLISWDRSIPKLFFAIDGGKGGTDITAASLASWPERIAEKVSVGSWVSGWSGHYCETRLFSLIILDNYLQATDPLVREHLKSRPRT